MERMIVAFEREDNARQIREILESEGEASCLLCRSAAEVKRLVRKRHIRSVICGFKLPDSSGEALRMDLPQDCAFLMIAPAGRLELCSAPGIVKLAAPVRRQELVDSVRALLHRPAAGHQRTEEELALVRQAKEILMERRGMTEEQAHRYLQKRSMDRGAKLLDTARGILETAINES